MTYSGCILLGIVFLASLFSPGTSPTLTPDSCPTVTIMCKEGEQCKGKKRRLSVTIAGTAPGHKPTFQWCVSAGAITGGQGTYEVEIDASTVDGEAVTVVVIIGGMNEHCDNVASYLMELSENIESDTATPNNGMHPTRINSDVIR